MRLTIGKMVWGVLGTLFLMTPLFASTAKEQAKAAGIATYNWAYAEEASSLLQQIRSHSVHLADDADFLDVQSRRNLLHWMSHADRLNQIKEHVNAMGEKLHRLQEIRNAIAPWQQKAVDQIMPSALALAASTEEAIAHLNEHRGRLWTAPYTDRVSDISEHAEDIRSTVNLFLDYGNTSDRLKGLESQLEMSGA